jgi:sRNA-binding protein
MTTTAPVPIIKPSTAWAMAAERFPALRNGKRPLAVGSGDALGAYFQFIGVPKDKIGSYLRWWFRSPAYLETLVEGAPRWHLDGAEDITLVTPEDATWAAEKLARRKAHLKARAKEKKAGTAKADRPATMATPAPTTTSPPPGPRLGPKGRPILGVPSLRPVQSAGRRQ